MVSKPSFEIEFLEMSRDEVKIMKHILCDMLKNFHEPACR